MNQNEFRKYAVKHRGISGHYLDDYMRHSITGLTPYIIEERPLNVAQLDVFSRLMMDRIIFLGDPINDYVANVIQAQMLFLESVDAKRDIQVYINSPGGSVYAGLGIYDTMQYIQPSVATICTGIAASMAAILLCAGTKGSRTGLKHARVMIHQPMGGAEGQPATLKLWPKRLVRPRKNFTKSLHSIPVSRLIRWKKMRIVTTG